MTTYSPFILLALCGIALAFDCPTGWQPNSDKTKCFIYSETDKPFAEAELDCENRGGNLVSIQNAKDNALVQAGRDRAVWIGAYDVHQTGSWKWTDGSAVKYSNWAAGQPSGIADKNCVVMDGFTGLWEAVNCEETFSAYTCQMVDPSLNKCPTGAKCHGGYAYLVDTKKQSSWEAAQKYCQENYINGQLASIHDKITELVVRQLSACSGFICFSSSILGGLVNYQNSTIWSDGTPWDYQLQTTNGGYSGDTLSISHSGSSNSASFSFGSASYEQVICEMKL
uniref:C-type lectin domain-containing protein n=1 Tax=Steinernema glaseri TaxID=37863 RepID=A0A1I7YC58_9BILA